jgi:hypothetical protein
MDVKMSELREIDHGEDKCGRQPRKGEMESLDGTEGETREEFGDSRASRSGGFGKVVEVDGRVEGRGGELEEYEGGAAKRSEGRSIRVGEDFEEELGRKAGVERDLLDEQNEIICRCLGLLLLPEHHLLSPELVL